MANKIKLKDSYNLREDYEPSDSEEEYSPREKQLLAKVRKRRFEESDGEEEVYQFSGSESEEAGADIADSDVEGKEATDDDLPDPKAWGKNKRIYHSTDYVDQDYGGFAGDEEVATLEEQEARVIQTRLAQQLGDEDFSLDFFTAKRINDKKDDGEQEVLIKSDLSQMSKRQKLQLLERESPEFSGLVDDFKNKLSMAKDNLKPVLNLIKEGKIPECSASQFVKTNFDLILNYCTNISFYLLLKAKKINIQNHPVVKKLYQYRQMLNQMEPVYEEIIKPQIDRILAAVEKQVELQCKNDNIKSKSKKRKIEKATDKTNKKLKLLTSLEGSSKDDKHDTGVSDNEDEYEGEDYFSGMESRADEKLPGGNDVDHEQSDESGFSDNDVDDKAEPESSSKDVLVTEDGEKRQITYQMSKNKGLTPHRKKEQRNPRVKHRMKYKKAKVRRKGAVREVRKEINRYAGEVSGIKANVKKSIKIKS